MVKSAAAVIELLWLGLVRNLFGWVALASTESVGKLQGGEDILKQKIFERPHALKPPFATASSISAELSQQPSTTHSHTVLGRGCSRELNQKTNDSEWNTLWESQEMEGWLADYPSTSYECLTLSSLPHLPHSYKIVISSLSQLQYEELAMFPLSTLLWRPWHTSRAHCMQGRLLGLEGHCWGKLLWLAGHCSCLLLWLEGHWLRWLICLQGHCCRWLLWLKGHSSGRLLWLDGQCWRILRGGCRHLHISCTAVLWLAWLIEASQGTWCTCISVMHCKRLSALLTAQQHLPRTLCNTAISTSIQR